LKEKIINFFKKETTKKELTVEKEIDESEPEEQLEKPKKNFLVRFFNLFSSSKPTNGLEMEIAETLMKGPEEVKTLHEKSEKEPITVDDINLCPEVTKENWLQLFMGKSFMCFVSFSLNLSVLIASFLLYF